MATVPIEVTAVAGTVLTAATWNSNVRDAINFIIAPPLAVLRQTVSQSLAANFAWNHALFDTEDIDRDNGHSTVTNTDRYTAQTAGWYDIKTTVYANNIAASGYVAAGFLVGAASSVMTARATHSANTGWTVSVTTAATAYINPGDYVVAIAENGTNTAGTTSVGTSEGASRMDVRWVST